LLERATLRFDDLDERLAVVRPVDLRDLLDLATLEDFVDFLVVLAKVSSWKKPRAERSNSKAIRAANERPSLFIIKVLVLKSDPPGNHVRQYTTVGSRERTLVLRVDQTSIRVFNERFQVSLTVMEHPDEALRPESKGQTDLWRESRRDISINQSRPGV